ncbi:uncharacterized protein [Bos mutus]|uniref:uncharacterized protein n=1 Tax=Bos mutus TaxID=72004 RepID=UPI0038B5F42A
MQLIQLERESEDGASREGDGRFASCLCSEELAGSAPRSFPRRSAPGLRSRPAVSMATRVVLRLDQSESRAPARHLAAFLVARPVRGPQVRLLYHPSHQGLAGRFFTASATWEAVFGRQESNIEVSAGPGSFLPLPALCGPRPSWLRHVTCFSPCLLNPPQQARRTRWRGVGWGWGGCFRPPRQEVVGPGPGGTGETERLGQTGLHTQRTRWPCPQRLPRHRADPGHPSLVLCGAPLLSLLQHSRCSWAQKFLRKHHLAPGSRLPLKRSCEYSSGTETIHLLPRHLALPRHSPLVGAQERYCPRLPRKLSTQTRNWQTAGPSGAALASHEAAGCSPPGRQPPERADLQPLPAPAGRSRRRLRHLVVSPSSVRPTELLLLFSLPSLFMKMKSTQHETILK